MRKGILVVLISFSFFLVGCTQDLPPEPGTFTVPVGKASEIYRGYAPPYDVFDDNKQIFFLDKKEVSLGVNDNSFNLNTKVVHEGGVIYKYGFYYANNRWNKFEFDGQTIGGSSWIGGRAAKELKLESGEVSEGENYVIAYSCKKHDGRWKCGQKTREGPGKKWVLQTYYVGKTELPEEPIDPAEPIAGTARVYPSGRIVKPGTDFNINLVLNARKEVLANKPGASLVARKPDGKIQSIPLKPYREEPTCSESKRREFNCHYSYYITTSFQKLGDYSLTPKFLNIGKIKTLRNGSVRVVKEELFEENVIEKDIESFIFQDSEAVLLDTSTKEKSTTFWALYTSSSTKISVSVTNANKEWWEPRIENYRESSSWKLTNIGGYKVYKRQRAVNLHSFVDYAWLSGGTLVKLTASSRKEIKNLEPVLEAYLDKHPTGEATSEKPYFCKFKDTRYDEGGAYTATNVESENKCKDYCLELEERNPWGERYGECRFHYEEGSNSTNEGPYRVIDYLDACGNGVIDPGEQCDGSDFGGVSRACSEFSENYEYGILECTRNCRIDTSSCTGSVEESWTVKSPDNKLELSENLIEGENKESISDVRRVVGEEELPRLLQNWKVSNQFGEYQSVQALYFEDASTGFATFDEGASDDRPRGTLPLPKRSQSVSDFLYFQDGKQIARYGLEFESSLQSNIESPASLNVSVLPAYDSLRLRILGQTHTIFRASRDNRNSIDLTLFEEGMKGSLSTGESHKFVFGEGEYRVTLDFVDSDSAKFTINGEPTMDLGVGETGTFADGMQIGVSEITFEDGRDGNHTAEFYVGTKKIEIKDTNIRDSRPSHKVRINDELVGGLEAWVEGSDDDQMFKINGISVNMKAEGDYYVGADSTLSQNDNFDSKELLFTENWDIEYKGLDFPESNDISINRQNVEQYYLDFVDKNGNKVSLPLAFVESGSSEIRVGSANNDLVLIETEPVRDRDFFTVMNTQSGMRGGEREVFALQYLGTGVIGGQRVISFKDLGSGETIRSELNDEQEVIAEIPIGNATYNVYSAVNDTTQQDFDIHVDMINDNELTNVNSPINTEYGAEVKIIEMNSKVVVRVRTANSNHYDTLTPTEFFFDIKPANGEPQASIGERNMHNFLKTGEGIRSAYSSYGAIAEFKERENGNEAIIKYLESQVLPTVKIISSD